MTYTEINWNKFLYYVNRDKISYDDIKGFEIIEDIVSSHNLFFKRGVNYNVSHLGTGFNKTMLGESIFIYNKKYSTSFGVFVYYSPIDEWYYAEVYKALSQGASEMVEKLLSGSNQPVLPLFYRCDQFEGLIDLFKHIVGEFFSGWYDHLKE